MLIAAGVIGLALACINYYMTTSNVEEGQVMNVEDGMPVNT